MCQSLSIWDPLIIDISPNTLRQQISALHCSTIYTWVSYSVPDFYLSLPSNIHLHVIFLFRSRFLPFTVPLFTRRFLVPLQFPAFHCSTIDTWGSYSVPDSCLSLLNYLNVGFLFRSRFLPLTAQLYTHGFLIPFQISFFHCPTGFLDPFPIPAFHCPIYYTWVSYSDADFCLSLPNFIHVGFLIRSRSCLSLLNYLHMGFLFRSRILPFTVPLLPRGLIDPFQIPAFHCPTIYTRFSWSVPDSCLSLPSAQLLYSTVLTNIFFSPFNISSFHCPTTFLGFPFPRPKSSPYLPH